MKKSYIVLSLLLAVAFVLESCSKSDDDTMDTPVEEKITYQSHIKSIVSNKCTTCHSSIAPSAGLALDSYSLVKESTQNGSLIQRINDEAYPMPPLGLMSATDRAFFDKWKEGGYLEQ